MTRLHYFTERTVEDLRANVSRRLDAYCALAEENQSLPFIRDSEDLGIRSSRLEFESFGARLLRAVEKFGHSSDSYNALVVYNSLHHLTPLQAADERLWTYICHTDCAPYVARRWLRSLRPDNERTRRQKVLNHFFAKGNRALVRDNSVSRLWWLGYIASQVDCSNPRQFLEILLYKQDVRSALIERPSISMNRDVLRSIYQVMKEHWQAKELFERRPFRRWMIGLNRRCGVTLLDVLPEAVRVDILRAEAKNALDT